MRLNRLLLHSIPRTKRDLFLQLQKTGKVTMESKINHNAAAAKRPIEISNGKNGPEFQ